MKILLGYNGSEAAKAAIQDLSLAGLPVSNDVLVLTVAESWQRPTTLAEAGQVAEEARHDILGQHPGWIVETKVTSGSAPSEILTHADDFHPDLIVVGEPQQKLSHEGPFLGITSHKILTESPYSIRIARPSTRTARSAVRLLVGFDGSRGAISSISTILSRVWPRGTEVCLLAIADSSVLDTIGRFTPQIMDATIEAKFAVQWAETLAAASLKQLKLAGLSARVEVKLGNPKFELERYASIWEADSIFVGPHCAPNSFERFLIGSVSAAVAAKASCSVEVVRT